MDNNLVKFFLEKAPALDIKEFCENNGYYLEILGSNNFALVRKIRGDE